MKDSSQTLSRGLQLLSLLGESGEGWSVRRLAASTGLSRTIIQRLLNSLEAEGFIVRRPDRIGYVLSMKMWRLGCRAASSVGIQDLARPHLEDLGQRTNETVKLSVLDRLEVVSLDSVECSQTLRAYIPIGGRASARVTATGRAILAFHESDAAYASFEYSDRERAEFKQVRRRGYAINHGEWDRMVGAIASPVFNANGEAVASVGIILPLMRLNSAKTARMGALCVETAAKLSADLGYSGPVGAPLRRVV